MRRVRRTARPTRLPSIPRGVEDTTRQLRRMSGTTTGGAPWLLDCVDDEVNRCRFSRPRGRTVLGSRAASPLPRWYVAGNLRNRPPRTGTGEIVEHADAGSRTRAVAAGSRSPSSPRPASRANHGLQDGPGSWSGPREPLAPGPPLTGPSPAARQRPACLAAYTNTGPHAPLPAGSHGYMPGCVHERRPAPSSAERGERTPAQRSPSWVKGVGEGRRTFVQRRRVREVLYASVHACGEDRTTRTQAAVYAARPDGLYAGVHDDTAARGSANTYAWVRARQRNRHARQRVRPTADRQVHRRTKPGPRTEPTTRSSA